MPLKSLYDSNMVQLHILGKPATGELARPFKAAGMFGATPAGPASDQASIKGLLSSYVFYVEALIPLVLPEAEKRAGAAKKDL